MPWKIFGSNGHLTQPIEGIINGFTRRKAVNHTRGETALGYGKTFARVTNKLHLLTHHSDNGDGSVYYPNMTRVEFGKHLDKVHIDEDTILNQPLQLNHYMFQSREYYEKVKCQRGGGQSGKIPKYTMAFYDEHEPHANKLEDLGLKNRREGMGNRCMSPFAFDQRRLVIFDLPPYL